MSFFACDRHGAGTTKYSPDAGTGCVGRTWWPDYGPGIRDFSKQNRCPVDHLFEQKVAARPKQCGYAEAPPEVHRQFRSPLQDAGAIAEHRVKAHQMTALQGSISSLVRQQKKMDLWYESKGGTVPIKPSQAEVRKRAYRDAEIRRCCSESDLQPKSKEEMVRMGFVVGRHQKGIASGSSQVEGARNLTVAAAGPPTRQKKRPGHNLPSAFLQDAKSKDMKDVKSLVSITRSEWPEPNLPAHRTFKAKMAGDVGSAVSAGLGSSLSGSLTCIHPGSRALPAGEAGSASYPRVPWSTIAHHERTPYDSLGGTF